MSPFANGSTIHQVYTGTVTFYICPYSGTLKMVIRSC